VAVDVLLGLQWGDEGKGKIVDTLAPNYQLICRFQGGPNAGHTLYINGQKVVLHTIPSGIFHNKILNIIGNGVVIDPVTLQKEISMLTEVPEADLSTLKIARKAHLILPTHRWLDAASEKAKGHEKIGSTLRGIGPTYMDKTGRNGLRFGDIFLSDFEKRYDALKAKHMGLLEIYGDLPGFNLSAEENKWMEAIEKMRKLEPIDCASFIYEQIQSGHNILAEGAQGSMLDIDFGTYPYVTSSNTITAGVCTGLGVAPKWINKVIGISKAYCTRVGGGPFPTELHDDTGMKIMKAGHEFGATTGRPRRCGWIDLVQLKYSCMINGVTDLIMTKADVLSGFDPIKAATSYRMPDGSETTDLPYQLEIPGIEPVFSEHPGWHENLERTTTWDELPDTLISYVGKVEDYLSTKITHVSVGPERDQIISSGH
jgi:adenylosuccinate synthase